MHNNKNTEQGDGNEEIDVLQSSSHSRRQHLREPLLDPYECLLRIHLSMFLYLYAPMKRPQNPAEEDSMLSKSFPTHFLGLDLRSVEHFSLTTRTMILDSRNDIVKAAMLGALASCTLRPTLSLLLGHVMLVAERLRLKALKKLTWPNERGSVGRRVQKASAPSTALVKDDDDWCYMP
ncbi:hypothetical protein SLEP1_g32503 [Rubroshorea leprosula]|uniref:Uncharacterized protein n=1 Tax=Rubroshorea leprosula TaxID=152421 RepID=A0AAV5KDH6_9ROSI|nr:hypothetical protein SLEP1_g32503 [Rubroshorea leprosula]